MDFSKHIQKAEEALKRRNHDFAVELYRQLVDLDLDHAEARAGLRRALRRREEAKRGGKLLGKVAGAVPLQRARAMRKLGRNDAAARALEDYLKSSPLDPGANLLLGQCLEDAGHYNAARAVYEFVAEIAPKNPAGLKRAGAMMQRAGEAARALEYYERALEADPRDQEALKARKDLAAETALSRSSLDQVAHSREAIVDKDEARRLERSRRMHLGEDELREELERLEGRRAEEPSNPDLLAEIAAVHERLGDAEAALELVERALEYRRDSFDLLSKAGDLRSKTLKRRIRAADKEGRSDEAERLERELQEHEVADWRKRVELRPGDALQRLQLARRLVRAGELDGAITELQRCVDDPRARADALLLLGQCFRQKGILDLARKELERALELAGERSERAKEILYDLGAIAEDQGAAPEARGYYARVYEVDIGFKDVAEKMKQLS